MKLTPTDIERIRELHFGPQRLSFNALGRMYGCHHTTILYHANRLYDARRKRIAVVTAPKPLIARIAGGELEGKACRGKSYSQYVREWKMRRHAPASRAIMPALPDSIKNMNTENEEVKAPEAGESAPVTAPEQPEAPAAPAHE